MDVSFPDGLLNAPVAFSFKNTPDSTVHIGTSDFSATTATMTLTSSSTDVSIPVLLSDILIVSQEPRHASFPGVSVDPDTETCICLIPEPTSTMAHVSIFVVPLASPGIWNRAIVYVHSQVLLYGPGYYDTLPLLKMNEEHERNKKLEKRITSLTNEIQTLSTSTSLLEHTSKKWETLYSQMESENQVLTTRARHNSTTIDTLIDELVTARGGMCVMVRPHPVTSIRPPAPKHHFDHPFAIVDGKSYRVDKVFSTSATDTEVFNSMQRLIETVFTGRNPVIIAYGRTGSGKTWTMDRLVENTVTSVFERRELEGCELISVQGSYVEVYGTKTYSLFLNPPLPTKPVLDYKLSGSGTNATWASFPSCPKITFSAKDDCIKAINLGKRVREKRDMKLFGGQNSESSRSHTVFSLIVQRKLASDDTSSITGTVQFVDLAGNEEFPTITSSSINEDAVVAARKEFKDISSSLSELSHHLKAVRCHAMSIAIEGSETLTQAFEANSLRDKSPLLKVLCSALLDTQPRVVIVGTVYSVGHVRDNNKTLGVLGDIVGRTGGERKMSPHTTGGGLQVLQTPRKLSRRVIM